MYMIYALYKKRQINKITYLNYVYIDQNSLQTKVQTTKVMATINNFIMSNNRKTALKLDLNNFRRM